MRQNFIWPSYLPTITESFLRDDFNFAEYLTLCLEKVLKSLFKISSATILTILLVLFYWAAISTIDNDFVEVIIFLKSIHC